MRASNVPVQANRHGPELEAAYSQAATSYAATSRFMPSLESMINAPAALSSSGMCTQFSVNLTGESFNTASCRGSHQSQAVIIQLCHIGTVWLLTPGVLWHASMQCIGYNGAPSDMQLSHRPSV